MDAAQNYRNRYKYSFSSYFYSSQLRYIRITVEMAPADTEKDHWSAEVRNMPYITNTDTSMNVSISNIYRNTLPLLPSSPS